MKEDNATIDWVVIRKAMKAAVAIAYRDNLRPHLNAVQVSASGGHVQLSATDGNRLIRIAVEATVTGSFGFLAPRVNCQRFVSVPQYSREQQTCTVRKSGIIEYPGGSVNLTHGTPEVMCDFPPVDSVIPKQRYSGKVKYIAQPDHTAFSARLLADTVRIAADLVRGNRVDSLVVELADKQHEANRFDIKGDRLEALIVVMPVMV